MQNALYSLKSNDDIRAQQLNNALVGQNIKTAQQNRTQNNALFPLKQQEAQYGVDAAEYQLQGAKTANVRADQAAKLERQVGLAKFLQNGIPQLASVPLEQRPDLARRMNELGKSVGYEIPPEYLTDLSDRALMTFDRTLQAFIPKAEQKMLEVSKAGVASGDGQLYNVMKDGSVQPTGLSAPEKTAGVEVNVDTGEKRESKFNEKTGAHFSDLYVEKLKTADVARKNTIRLQRAEQMIDKIETGSMAGIRTQAKKFAKGLGIDLEKDLGITDDVGEAEMVEALSIQFALDLVAQTKGAITDNEMRLFMENAAGLRKTRKGNKLILSMAKKINDLSIQEASMARQYVKENGTLDEGYYDRLDKFHLENPIFTDDVQKEIDTIMQGGGATGKESTETRFYRHPDTGEEVRYINGEWVGSSVKWDGNQWVPIK